MESNRLCFLKRKKKKTAAPINTPTPRTEPRTIGRMEGLDDSPGLTGVAVGVNVEVAVDTPVGPLDPVPGFPPPVGERVCFECEVVVVVVSASVVVVVEEEGLVVTTGESVVVVLEVVVVVVVIGSLVVVVVVVVSTGGVVVVAVVLAGVSSEVVVAVDPPPPPPSKGVSPAAGVGPAPGGARFSSQASVRRSPAS